MIKPRAVRKNGEYRPTRYGVQHRWPYKISITLFVILPEDHIVLFNDCLLQLFSCEASQILRSQLSCSGISCRLFVAVERRKDLQMDSMLSCLWRAETVKGHGSEGTFLVAVGISKHKRSSPAMGSE